MNNYKIFVYLSKTDQFDIAVSPTPIKFDDNDDVLIISNRKVVTKNSHHQVIVSKYKKSVALFLARLLIIDTMSICEGNFDTTHLQYIEKNTLDQVILDKIARFDEMNYFTENPIPSSNKDHKYFSNTKSALKEIFTGSFPKRTLLLNIIHANSDI